MDSKILNEFPTLLPFLERIESANADFDLKGGVEEEVKFNTKKENIDIYLLLKEAGAEHKSFSFERNYIYDFKTRDNLKNNVLLRIRRERELLKGEQQILLTLKKKLSEEGTKRQLEYETIFNDEALDILDEAIVGSELEVSFLYEKFRHEFIIPNIDVKIVVDVLPEAGRFVEIEGKEEEIEKACEKLKLNSKNKISQNYICMLKSYKTKKDSNEFRFSQYESFVIAENELLLASKYFEELNINNHSCGGCCSSCGSGCKEHCH